MTPAKGAGHLFEFLNRDAGGKASPNQGAGGSAGNRIDGNVVFHECLYYSDMGNPARRATGQRETNTNAIGSCVCHDYRCQSSDFSRSFSNSENVSS